MRAVALALAILWAVPAWAEISLGHRSGGTPVPAAASAVGYTTLALSTESNFSNSTVDVSGTYAHGFQWYLWNFFGNPVTSASIAINADSSITLSPPAIFNGAIVSAAQIGGAPGYVGTAFGCGAYITAEISFVPVGTFSAGWPSLWTMSIEHLAGLSGQHWTGQASGYDHFAEADIMEFDRGAPHTTYGSTLHEYWGIINSTCPVPAGLYCEITSPFTPGTVTPPAGVNFNQYHRYAMLWVPATGSTNGFMTFYFDDMPIGPTFSWAQFTNQSPPPVAPWIYGVFDTQHLPVLIGSNSGSMNVKSVDVWQGPGACNLTN